MASLIPLGFEFNQGCTFMSGISGLFSRTTNPSHNTVLDALHDPFRFHRKFHEGDTYTGPCFITSLMSCLCHLGPQHLFADPKEIFLRRVLLMKLFVVAASDGQLFSLNSPANIIPVCWLVFCQLTKRQSHSGGKKVLSLA